MQPSTPTPAKTLRLGDVLALAGSLLVFSFSFAPFVKIKIPGLLSGAGLADTQNAWATETFMAPLTWFVVLAGLLVIAGVALRYVGVRNARPLGFTLAQLELNLSLFMLVVLFGMVTSEKHLIFGVSARALGEGGASLDSGWGAILMLVGAIAAAAGSVFTILSVGPVIYPRPATPAPQPTFGQPQPFPGQTQPFAGQPQPFASEPPPFPQQQQPTSGVPFPDPDQPRPPQPGQAGQ